MSEDSTKYKCWTKGIITEKGNPEYSPNWALARRAWFCIHSDRVECGDWAIPFDSVSDVTVFRTRQWFIPVTVLQISTTEQNYQFGFNPWARPVENLPLEYTEKRIRLGYSPTSLAIRILLLVMVLHWIWKNYLSD